MRRDLSVSPRVKCVGNNVTALYRIRYDLFRYTIVCRFRAQPFFEVHLVSGPYVSALQYLKKHGLERCPSPSSVLSLLRLSVHVDLQDSTV